MTIENLTNAVEGSKAPAEPTTTNETVDTKGDTTPEPQAASEKSSETNTDIKASWIETLNDDFKTNKSLNKFPDVNALAKSYIEMEKQNGSRISLLNENSTDEDKNSFYNRLGRPEDKSYFSDDEKASYLKTGSTDDSLKAYQEIFHKSGLTKSQGKSLLDEFSKHTQNGEENYKKQMEEERNSNFEVLTKTHGDKLDEKIKLVESALSNYGNAELNQLVEETNYNPALINLLMNIGSNVKSDKLVTGKTEISVNDKESAKKELKKLEIDKDFMLQYNDRDNAGNETAIKRMKELYELAYS